MNGKKTTIPLVIVIFFTTAILGMVYLKYDFTKEYLAKTRLQFNKIATINDLERNIALQKDHLLAYVYQHHNGDLVQFRELSEINLQMERDLLNTVREEREPLARGLYDLNNQLIEYCEKHIVPLVQSGNHDEALKGAVRAREICDEMLMLAATLSGLRNEDTLSVIDNVIGDYDKTVTATAGIFLFVTIVGTLAAYFTGRRNMMQNVIFRMVLATTRNAVVTVDGDCRITHFNPVAEQLFGISGNRVLGRPFHEVFTGQANPDEVALTYPVEEVLRSRKDRCREDYNYTDREGWQYNLLVDCLSFARHREQGAMLLLRDITERKVVEERLSGMAIRDSLTMLYNQTYMKRVLEKEASLCRKTGQSLSFMLMDIDNFKFYNDTYGHMAGDELLRIFARVLNNFFGIKGTVARYGGDEFGVVLPGIDMESAVNMVEGFIEVLTEYPFPYKNSFPNGKFTVSIGLSSYNENCMRAEELIQVADENMYRIKRESKKDSTLYSCSLRELDFEIQPEILNTVETLLNVINAKDSYTYEHSYKVAFYSELLAMKLLLPREEVKKVKIAALLHDLGKIDIPRELLNKPSTLTAQEVSVIRQHAITGSNIVRQFSSLEQIIPYALYHHERFDGRGYPEGLKGKQIPLGARIIAIADSFHAMTTNRPYKRAKDLYRSIEELEAGCSTQFDPHLVNIFIDEVLLEKTALEVRGTYNWQGL